MKKKGMPTRREIEKEATKLYMEANWRISDITPERHELQEEGLLRRAQHKLMGSGLEESGGVSHVGARSQMSEYIKDIADELKLSIIPRREHREQQRKVQAFDIFKRKHPRRVKRVNGYRIVFPSLPAPKPVKVKAPKRKKKPRKVKYPKPRPKIPKIIAKPKKKRRKSHTERTGKTMRSLAKIKGVNVFSFPDDVWKVKRKRRRKK